MSKLRLKISMPVDGVVPGHSQGAANPLAMDGGIVGDSTAAVQESLANIGASVMRPLWR